MLGIAESSEYFRDSMQDISLKLREALRVQG